MQVSNINTPIISNNGLSNITNHTTKPTLINNESNPWNGSVIKTTEATATLRFLDKLMNSVDQDVGKKIEKRETKVEGYLKMSICGPGQSNEHLSVSIQGKNGHVSTGTNGQSKGINSNTVRYTGYEMSHNEELRVKTEYRSGPPLFQAHAEDEFSLKCEDGRPFIEAGEKVGEVLFSSGCDNQARETCKDYNKWQPDTGSNCTIL